MRRGRQSLVRAAMAHRRLRIESAPHRFDVFLPDVVVEHEIAQPRMALEVNAEQVLGLALVPVRGMHPIRTMLGKTFSASGALTSTCTQPAVAFAVEDVAQLPLARAFLDDQAGEARSSHS